MRDILQNNNIDHKLIYTRPCDMCGGTVQPFIQLLECCCYVDFDGAGYTYQDEYGPCDYCEETPFVCLNCYGSFKE